MKKKLYRLAALCLAALLLSGCTSQPTHEQAAVQAVASSQQTLSPDEAPAQAQEESPATAESEIQREELEEMPVVPEAEKAPAEIPAAPGLTDEYVLLEVLGKAEQALPDNSFNFSSPAQLSSEQLLMLFLMLMPRSELETCRSAADARYYFTEDYVRSTLDRYFEGYTFDIAQCSPYDTQSGAVVMNVLVGNCAGFGQYLYLRVTEQSADGNTATYTVDFCRTLYHDGEPASQVYRQKVYTVEYYDGGWYYRSAKTVFCEPEETQRAEEAPLPDFDPSAAVTSEEFVLSNGVRLGMRYDEVIETLGGVVAPAVPEEEYPYFWHDGIFYSFSRDEDGSYRLNNLQITENNPDVFTLHGLRTGMPIEAVFATIPARDTELKQWAQQMLYDDGENRAWLEFVAMSYYSMRIFTEKYVADITFSRVGTQVKYITLSVMQ